LARSDVTADYGAPAADATAATRPALDRPKEATLPGVDLDSRERARARPARGRVAIAAAIAVAVGATWWIAPRSAVRESGSASSAAATASVSSSNASNASPSALADVGTATPIHSLPDDKPSATATPPVAAAPKPSATVPTKAPTLASAAQPSSTPAAKAPRYDDDFGLPQ
jgi:cytoskeletal protein RodZ